MERLAIGTIIHPRRSSDFCVHAEAERDGRLYAISGVIDTVGRPRRSRIKKVFRELQRQTQEAVDASMGPEGLDELDARFRKLMSNMNRFARETGRRQHGFLGFCFAIAVRVDRQVRVHWMGDCRGYQFKSSQSQKCGYQAECLTLDNNKLSSEMIRMDLEQPGMPMEMLKSEMLELSRQLELYLGIGNDQHFESELHRQSLMTEIAPGEMLMLTTDGILMPIVRYEVANAGFKLTRDRLYLEKWFEAYLENGEYLRSFQGIDVWNAMLGDIKAACLKYTKSKRRYRDDMAVVYMC